MTYRDIYDAALPLMGEGTGTDDGVLEEKAKELIPMLVYSLLPLDRLKKRSVGEASISTPQLQVELDDYWPLEKAFLPCAAHYLASYMIGADDPDLANLLYVRAEAMRRIISDNIPYTVERI